MGFLRDNYVTGAIETIYVSNLIMKGNDICHP